LRNRRGPDLFVQADPTHMLCKDMFELFH
jgi:hypothetical protein